MAKMIDLANRQSQSIVQHTNREKDLHGRDEQINHIREGHARAYRAKE